MPIRRVVSFLRERQLSVLPADKEGGFVVLTEGEFGGKALEAITSVFNLRQDVSLNKLKGEGKRLCNRLNLTRLAKSVENSRRGCLQIMFSVKTHKQDWPLRVIVSEHGTWQKSIGLWLQDKLKILTIDDPFLVRSSEEVVDFLKMNADVGFLACSLDIKDLYYSLPHDKLRGCVEDCIQGYGVLAFQNAAGVTVDDFLDLLSFYLKSTFPEWNKDTYLQKEGICIGSCLAPILSDIFLAYHDRVLSDYLSVFNLRKCFRFVDDFLVFLNYDSTHFHSMMDNLLTMFSDALHPLKLTHEVPVDGVIRFLDIKLTFFENHVCWMYQPRANKPLLPFSSSHSKLVKRGIATFCFKNALHKSCHHVTHLSVLEQ